MPEELLDVVGIMIADSTNAKTKPRPTTMAAMEKAAAT